LWSPPNHHAGAGFPPGNFKDENVINFTNADKFEDASMDIYSAIGSEVKFTNAGGLDYQKENAAKVLTLGEVYTVARIEVHNWHTDVWLEGFDKPFNSVQFANV
jgi:hypothetical protein